MYMYMCVCVSPSYLYISVGVRRYLIFFNVCMCLLMFVNDSVIVSALWCTYAQLRNR